MQNWPRLGTPRCRKHGNLICGRTSKASTPAECRPQPSPRGARVDFTGNDVFRIDDGLLAEYWLNSDVHVMVAQLGMTT